MVQLVSDLSLWIYLEYLYLDARSFPFQKTENNSNDWACALLRKVDSNI